MDATWKTFNVMQLFVKRVQHSINSKEKWATETQSAIIPEDTCHILNIFSDKVSSFVLRNVFFQKPEWRVGDKGKDMAY